MHAAAERRTSRWWIGLVAGAGAGFLALGVGGRLAMRWLALRQGQAPVLSLGGTITVLGAGVACGVGAAFLRSLLDRAPQLPLWARRALFALACLLVTLRGLHPVSARALAVFLPLVAGYVVLVELAWRRLGLGTAARPRREPDRPRRPFVATTVLAVAAAVAPITAASLGAQSPARTDSARVPARMPSVALPPALARVLRDYERAWRAGDARAVAALFAPDGLVLSNGRPPARGRQAIEATYAAQGGPLVLRALAFATADTVGYIIGAYGYADRGTPAAAVGQTPVPDLGKFTLTLRRERGGDGRWLIVSDMDNSNGRSP